MQNAATRMLFWVVIFLPGLAVGQNLIPNGSFETYANCPQQDNLLSEAVPWFNPNRATPDFYHQCHPLAQMQLSPHSGQGLARLFVDQGWGEYLAVPLRTPLDARDCYFFEMYVALESPRKVLTQTLGAYFSAQPLNSPTTSDLFPVSPQVLDAQLSPTTQALHWERITGYVRPQGGERYVTIGNFGKLPAMLGYYYLFIDDVSLLPIRLDLGNDTTLCSRQSPYRLNAQTPGATGYRWNTGSTSSTLLVTQPGKYWVTVSTPCKTLSDTITVDYALDFDLGRDTTLCNGNTLTLTIPAPKTATFLWQDGSNRNTFLVSQPGRYRVRVTQAGCTAADSLMVQYVDSPKLELGANQEPCGLDLAVIRPTFAGGRFGWQDGFAAVERPVSRSGVLRATVQNACATVSDSVVIDYSVCGCRLYTPDVFTPNGDGHNDRFQPFGCGDLTLTLLTIFDRWGEVIFQTSSPPFEWDGSYRSGLCPTDVYGWRIDYNRNRQGRPSPERSEGTLSLVR